jgi:hypothetical protein
VGEYLSKGDLKALYVTCKVWRDAVLVHSLRRLSLVLTDVNDGSSPGALHHVNQLRLKLLKYVTQRFQLEIITIADGRWPSSTQLDATLKAVADQPNVSTLCLRLATQLAAPDHIQLAARSTSFTRMLQQTCDRLASASSITSLRTP